MATNKSSLNIYNSDMTITNNGFSGVENKNEYNTAVKTFNNYGNNEYQMSDQFVITACMAGNLNVIKEFLETGFSVNQVLLTGWTLLLYAASTAQANIIQYLLSVGADPNLHQEGYTPLMALSNTNKGSPSQRKICLKYLIDGKVNVNASNKVKETALMYACKMQEVDFIMELLKHIDHINFADSEQRTALFYAVIENRYDVTKILIEHGADITWINYRGLNPYDIALSKGHDELIPLLTINHEEDEQNNIKQYKTSCITSWLDMFPSISELDMDTIDSDVISMLCGMGLESYKACFRGIDLKTFLRLREEDLERLGIDISIHRTKFVDELLRFHKHEWSSNLMNINKAREFTPFEVIRVLGNINKQLNVMTSSIYFSKNVLDSLEEDEGSNITLEEREKLQIEMKNIQVIALRIQDTTNRIKSLAEVMKELNSDICLVTYIEKKKKRSQRWVIITAITIAGFYLFRTGSITRLWGNKKSSFRGWSILSDFSLTSILLNNILKLSLLFQRN